MKIGNKNYIMSENCHNHGRIYWNFLCDSMVLDLRIIDNGYTIPDVCMKRKQLIHFSNTFHQVIKDFAETYKKEDNDGLNPTKWQYEKWTESSGGQIAYPNSLVSLYILLNLILLNSHFNNTQLFSSRQEGMYRCCLGLADLGLSTELQDEFNEIYSKLFTKGKKYSWCHIDLHINTITKELVQEIKDFLKKIFVCLIRIYQSDYHRWTLEPSEIYVKIHHMFFYNSKLDHHPDYESHYPNEWCNL